MSNKTSSSGNKLAHYMKAPFRALVRARDMYVSSMSGCAGRVERGRVISSAAAVPRSRSHGFYQSSGDNDIAELIRAASQGARPRDPAAVPRSQSVAVGFGIGRIDEDEACEFGEQDDAVVAYPRSRSCAVVQNSTRVGAVGA